MVLNAVVYMAAPMSMPATMKESGWVWGTILFTHGSVVTLQTGYLIGALVVANPACDTYPALAEYVFQMLHPDRARAKVLGNFGRRLCMGLQFSTYYLDVVAQLLYCVQYLDQLSPDSPRWPLCQWSWFIVVYLLCLPMVAITNMSESRWTAIPCMVALLAMVMTLVGEVATTRPWDCRPGPRYTPPSASSVFVSLSAWAYGFGGHGMFPEMVREMREPKDWNKVLGYTYLIVVPMYGLCSYLGYYAYGDFAMANINLNFQDNLLNRFSIFLQLVVCYYLVTFSNLVLVMQIEQWNGISLQRVDRRARAKRFALRAAFLASQMFIGQMLLSAEGDTLLLLQSLSGAVGMTAFTYVLPFAFSWTLHGKDFGRLTKGWFAFNIGVGLVIMGTGVVTSVAGLVGNSHGVFNGDCRIRYDVSSSEGAPMREEGAPASGQPQPGAPRPPAAVAAATGAGACPGPRAAAGFWFSAADAPRRPRLPQYSPSDPADPCFVSGYGT